MKKFAGDITLNMCTKNHNHTMYGSSDLEWSEAICEAILENCQKNVKRSFASIAFLWS